MPAERKYRNPAERQKAYRKRQTSARIRELQAKGLPSLPQISTMPGTARWKAQKQAALSLLQEMLVEMEAYRDDRSDDWQDGEKGESFAETIEQVREACELLSQLP